MRYSPLQSIRRYQSISMFGGGIVVTVLILFACGLGMASIVYGHLEAEHARAGDAGVETRNEIADHRKALRLHDDVAAQRVDRARDDEQRREDLRFGGRSRFHVEQRRHVAEQAFRGGRVAAVLDLHQDVGLIERMAEECVQRACADARGGNERDQPAMGDERVEGRGETDLVGALAYASRGRD